MTPALPAVGHRPSGHGERVSQVGSRESSVRPGPDAARGSPAAHHWRRRLTPRSQVAIVTDPHRAGTDAPRRLDAMHPTATPTGSGAPGEVDPSATTQEPCCDSGSAQWGVVISGLTAGRCAHESEGVTGSVLQPTLTVDTRSGVRRRFVNQHRREVAKQAVSGKTPSPTIIATASTSRRGLPESARLGELTSRCRTGRPGSRSGSSRA